MHAQLSFGTSALAALGGCAIYAAFAVVTAVGSARRGSSVGTRIAEALAFPVTWVAWFVHDNIAAGRRPFRGR